MTGVPPFDTPAERRAWAFAAILGGCIVMTVFAAVAVYLVSGNAGLSFWLGIAAHAQILVGLTCIGALLVRRGIKLSKDGVEIDDKGSEDT